VASETSANKRPIGTPSPTENKSDSVQNELPNITTNDGDGYDLPDLASLGERGGFWQDLIDGMPNWMNEIIALSLIIFGILSLTAQFSDTIVAITWLDILTQLFGYGSVIVSLSLLVLGLYLLFLRAGSGFTLSANRLLALEFILLCVLALLHVINDDTELRALARAGQGGGVIGWGLTVLPYWLLGRTFTILIFTIGLIASIGALFGFRQSQLLPILDKYGQRLFLYSERLEKEATPTVPTTEEKPKTKNKAIIATNKMPLMRIRANYDNLPPSLRPDAPELPTNQPNFTREELEQHPLFQKREMKTDFNLIGEVLKTKTDDGHQLVRRPDGREKRYFNISKMNETKKVGKRDKQLPELDLLQEKEMVPPEENEINHNVVLIENTLLEFDINIDVVDVQVGPTVTRYAIQPYRLKSDGTTERTRLSKIASYHTDLSLALSAKRLRLEIPVPGTNYMGIEVPNKKPSVVALRSVYESKDYYDMSQKNSAPLMVPLGRDVSGKAVAVDLAKMPHLLIAGTTGSGKSVCIAAVASSIIMNNMPDKVKMVMLDPKMVELSRFNGVPHLLGPVETDTDRIIGVLKWCTREMDRRYKLLEEHAVRNIDTYNAKFGKRRRGRDYMPYIVIMIDEIGDLMMSRPEETETAITRLAQMARAVGMHLVIATQRPSVDVITGLIKANFPGRISFAVASGVDSRVILDASGAENLLGSGDMLFLTPDAGAPKRVQGCFIDDDEVRSIVKHWHKWQETQADAGKVDIATSSPWERGLTRREFLAETDPMLEDAIEFVVETQEASASILQRRLGLGYPRAARIVDMLEELGVVGDPVGGGRARKVLIPKGEDPFKRIIEKRLEEKQNESD